MQKTLVKIHGLVDQIGDLLTEAEHQQSAADDIIGPGSNEWEIMRTVIENFGALLHHVESEAGVIDDLSSQELGIFLTTGVELPDGFLAMYQKVATIRGFGEI